jgi:hypothetical protein
MQTVTPIEEFKQRAIVDIYGPKGIIYKIYAKIFIYIFFQQFLLDINIWNNKIYFKNPLLVKEDKKIGLFRRWALQFYSSQLYNSSIIESKNLQY